MELYEELKYRYHPRINTGSITENIRNIREDSVAVAAFERLSKDHSELLLVQETMNERSFEIFHREKYFQREGGLSFVRELRSLRKRWLYETSEPLSLLFLFQADTAEYSDHRK